MVALDTAHEPDMSSQQNRVPAGVSSGGQFATGQRQAADVVLADLGFLQDAGPEPEPDGGWAAAVPQVGSPTPWGPTKDVDRIADGITRVSTAAGGGWKLTDHRNRQVPEILRNPDGWYDEDQGWAKAAIVFPDEPRIAALNERMAGVDDRAAADGISHAERVVREHYPHAYEKVTGREVLPGQSQVRDQEFTDRQKILHRMRYRPVTGEDRDTARHLYEQIGPVVAGNMNARARDVVTIPHGLLLQGCRSGRHRVEVSVREIGLGLREVTVLGPDGAKTGEATASGRGGLQRAMLAIGDGDLDTFIRLDRRVR